MADIARRLFEDDWLELRSPVKQNVPSVGQDCESPTTQYLRVSTSCGTFVDDEDSRDSGIGMEDCSLLHADRAFETISEVS